MYYQSAQQHTQYSSPVFIQQVYGPQQQYPVYPVVSPSWNPSVMPYFDSSLVRSGLLFLFKYLALPHAKSLSYLISLPLPISLPLHPLPPFIKCRHRIPTVASSMPTAVLGATREIPLGNREVKTPPTEMSTGTGGTKRQPVNTQI